MTNAISPNHDAYWNDSLAEELQHFLTKRLKCPDTAAEITHETYLRFFQASQTTPVNNARALAYRIALNLAIDYQRKAKVRSNRTVEVDFDVFTDKFPSTQAGPEQIAIAQQNLGTLEFESKPNHFGGETFYAQLSANLPDWVYCYVAKQPVN